jgi:lipopolysaccharide export system protein LptA
MPLPIYRLRRWLATMAVVFTAVVAGMYFFARMREHSVLKQMPGKIGYNIKQTASGFQFSKSEGGRTLFTIQASHVTEFKLNGRAELHNVSIVLYGKDSDRFDRIYGDDFSYDQKSGDVVAKGEVRIDLEPNPSGQTRPDQAVPAESKNPIHLRTSDLTFNRDSGIATTGARVNFSTSQATGWAMGARYNGHTNELVLPSRVHVVLNGDHPATLEASSAVVTSNPHVVVMQNAVLKRQTGTMQAKEATITLGKTNNIERVLARGDVQADTREAQGAKSGKTAAADDNHGSQIHARSDAGELVLTGSQSQLQTAILTGNVRVDRVGSEMMQGQAGRVVLNFAADNQLDKVHAENGVHLTQHALASAQPSGNAAQDVEIQAPVIDFLMVGNALDRAITSGPPQITIHPAESAVSAANKNENQKTVITAGQFTAHFDERGGKSQLTSVHGGPDARVVSTTAGQPDRISTSQTIDATFLPQGGIESVVQQGNVAFTDTQNPDKRTEAWGDRARYTPADQILTLTGSPRVVTGGMATTAHTVRINRATGDAFGDGDVKTTYSELKENPQGALLASSSPIHVTSASMVAHNSPADAIYTGKVRLWQDANVIEAPSILFDRDRRFVLAKGTASQPVSTVVVQANAAQPAASEGVSPGGSQSKKQKAGEKSVSEGRSSPITITGMQLTYDDAERKAHYQGGVNAVGAGFTEFSKTLDAYLAPNAEKSKRNQSLSGPAQLDHMVAEGSVLVRQPDRRAIGQKLVYTAAEDKFVLTGGPPSIFDAERGKITGVSLTFFRSDDRVLVEGEASSPVVTQTRVAR